MSHFTRVRTKLRDLDTLRGVLHDMGYKPESDPQGGQVVVRGWNGDTRQADLKIANGAFDIGFVQESGSYVAVGDFSGMRLNETKFAHELNRRYATATIKATASQQGFNLIEEVNQVDGSVKLVVERWA